MYLDKIASKMTNNDELERKEKELKAKVSFLTFLTLLLKSKVISTVALAESLVWFSFSCRILLSKFMVRFTTLPIKGRTV